MNIINYEIPLRKHSIYSPSAVKSQLVHPSPATNAQESSTFSFTWVSGAHSDSRTSWQLSTIAPPVYVLLSPKKFPYSPTKLSLSPSLRLSLRMIESLETQVVSRLSTVKKGPAPHRHEGEKMKDIKQNWNIYSPLSYQSTNT